MGKRIRERLERIGSRSEDRPEPDLQDGQEARARASEIEFVAEHVVSEEVYRVSAYDLEYLELVDTRGSLRGRFRVRGGSTVR